MMSAGGAPDAIIDGDNAITARAGKEALHDVKTSREPLIIINIDA